MNAGRTPHWRRNRRLIMLLAALLVMLPLAGLGPVAAQEDAQPATEQEAVPRHAIAMHGEPKYGPDFENFLYVDPDAYKGGDITLHAVGTFNSFNPYILEGDSYYTGFGGSARFIETLTDQSYDEAFSEYCLLCETIAVPEDRSFVVFTLRPEARWSDGTPVTADDVIFSWETLLEKGHPFYQDYWGSITEATRVDDLTVRFDFEQQEEQNRELPLIAGQLPVFQKAWWEGRAFDEPSLDVPVSSGPYRIVDVRAGQTFTFERNPDYWGADLPINRGKFNFDRITVDYYRDTTVALEAFKAGEYDFRYENNSKNWATAYEFPAVNEGLVTVEQIPNRSVNGMQGFVFNQRRDLFQDPRVREALAYAFDFEWSNETLFYGQYTRTKSYWDNSELANLGGEAAGEVLAYLEPWRDALPVETFTTTYEPPSTGGTEDGLRENIGRGLELLEQAGWTVNDEGVLANADGEPFAFEILLDSQSWERIVLPYIENLERMGITATPTLVDPSQFETQVEKFDYDMIVHNRGMSPSPGNEQRNYWTCQAAETEGSQNYWGVCNEAIDALVENVVQAESREDLVAATRALDRALLWQHLVVPHWHIRSDRVAYWNVIGRPEVSPDYNLEFNAWFYNPTEADLVRAAQEELEFVEPTEEGAEPAEEPTVDASEAVTETEEMTETAGTVPEEGEGGGLSTGLIVAIIAIVVVVAAVWLIGRGRGQTA